MISKKTKYGLKALTYIARNPDQMVPIAQIAERENIPHKFLESILLLLRKSGFLGSKKGKGGGYYLLREGNEITVAAVFRALEGPIAWLITHFSPLNQYQKATRTK